MRKALARGGRWLSAHAGTLAAVALWIGVWQAASVLVGSRILLAGPVETAVRLAQLVVTGEFWATVASSFGRIALGFAAGFAAALALGLVAGRWPTVGRVVAPAMSTLKSVPLVCVIVLLLMWVGSRRVSAIAVFLVVFPAVYFSVVEGLRARDGRLGELLGVFGVSGLRRFLADTWQQLLPYLVATSRNVCGMAWKSGVAAEVIGSPRGTIGERVYQSKLLLETGDLFAWTIVVVLASWACERAFVAALEATGPWTLRWASEMALRSSRSNRGGRPVPATVVMQNLTVGYESGPVVARGLSLRLEPGSRWLMAEESGAGKTTLIRTLVGLQPPLAGTVEVPRELSLVCQEARLVEGMSAEDNVVLAGGCDVPRARELLLELLPEDALGCPVRELSGGQRRRVEIVRALAHPSGLVVLDEPFASLDAATHEAAAAFVLRHLGGRTLLVASHATGDRGLLDVTGELDLAPAESFR